MKKWNWLILDNTLNTIETGECEIPEEKFKNEWKEISRRKGKFQEEHLETLIASGIREILPNSYIIERQFDISPTCDITAIDNLGKINFLELKSGTVNTEDIIYQTLQYVFDFGSKSFFEIDNSFKTFYARINYSIEQYVAALLEEMHMRRNESLRKYAASILGDNAIRRDSKESQIALSEFCRNHFLEEKYKIGNANEKVISNMNKSYFGNWDGAGGIKELFKHNFGYDLVPEFFNRYWKMVFVASKFSFESSDSERKRISQLYHKGLDFLFLNYKIYRNDKIPDRPHFAVVWYKNDTWKESMAEKHRKLAWIQKPEYFNEFMYALRCKEIFVSRAYGNYNSWKIKLPINQRFKQVFSLTWPGHHPNFASFSDTDKFTFHLSNSFIKMYSKYELKNYIDSKYSSEIKSIVEERSKEGNSIKLRVEMKNKKDVTKHKEVVVKLIIDIAEIFRNKNLVI